MREKSQTVKGNRGEVLIFKIKCLGKAQWEGSIGEKT